MSDEPSPWTPPSPIPRELTTERLVVRCYREPDAPAVFEEVERSRASLLPWLPWAGVDHLTIERTRARLAEFMATFDAPTAPPPDSIGYAMGIFERGSGRYVGGTGLSRIHASSGDAEVGYWIGESVRGRGYATEASRGVIGWAFRDPPGGWGLRRIRIFASERNRASCAVPVRLGLREEVRAKLDRWVDGIGYTDTVGWGVLRDEWRG